MGKGFLAFEDSRRVLEALDSLCYCSTSINTNIEILNLLYILQGYTERYSTLDAIDINRSNMTADVFKLGASNTYIFHDDLTYTKIENSSLPLGIEEEIIHTEIKLKDNDLILFSSDGIFENVLDEQKLLEFLDKLHNEGIRFALSNVLTNNGKRNEILEQWLKDNEDIYYYCSKKNNRH